MCFKGFYFYHFCKIYHHLLGLLINLGRLLRTEFLKSKVNLNE